MTSQTLYDILGVLETATPEEIKAAYLEKIQHVHADGVGSPEAANQLKYAYDVLSVPTRRTEYDASLQADVTECPVCNQPVRSEDELVGHTVRHKEELDVLQATTTKETAAFVAPINAPTDIPDAKGGASSVVVFQRIVALFLIVVGALYVLYLVSSELAYHTSVSGGADGVRLLVVTLGSLVFSAAWILPIGIWWMWKTFHPTSRVPPENHGHAQISSEQEEDASEDRNLQASTERQTEARTDRQLSPMVPWLIAVAVIALLIVVSLVPLTLAHRSSDAQLEVIPAPSEPISTAPIAPVTSIAPDTTLTTLGTMTAIGTVGASDDILVDLLAVAFELESRPKPLISELGEMSAQYEGLSRVFELHLMLFVERQSPELANHIGQALESRADEYRLSAEHWRAMSELPPGWEADRPWISEEYSEVAANQADYRFDRIVDLIPEKWRPHSQAWRSVDLAALADLGKQPPTVNPLNLIVSDCYRPVGDESVPMAEIADCSDASDRVHLVIDGKWWFETFPGEDELRGLAQLLCDAVLEIRFPQLFQDGTRSRWWLPKQTEWESGQKSMVCFYHLAN